MKEFITHRGELLEEGKTYLWSGVSEGLYTCLRWTDRPVKVRKIIENVKEYDQYSKKKVVETQVELYDYDDNQVITGGNLYFKENEIRFKRKKFLNIF